MPVTPTPTGWDALRFRRERMVGWFDPGQLARTGMQVVLSSLFGSFADKREMQAALDPTPRCYGPYEPDPISGDFWIDYVPDLGDGFDSTYTVAYQLSRESLTIPGEPAPLPRGNLLVMGGDEVYPRASRDEYHHRTYGPYEAALPSTPGAPTDNDPHLFAIPGNHDWYDGLTSFIRLFCQQRSIGRWRTQQHRSYWSVQLPHGWWLWGVDFQLESDIDAPQLAYFRKIAESVKQGDRIILCVPEPAWVQTWLIRRDAYDRVAFFERDVIAPSGATVPVVITGDLHHYSRYSLTHGADTPAAPRHLITCGLGGAYTYATHSLPGTLEFCADQGHSAPVSRRRYERECIYPSAEVSREESEPVRSFIFRRKPNSEDGSYWQNASFARMLGVLYLMFAWLLQSSRSVFSFDPAVVIFSVAIIVAMGAFALPLREPDAEDAAPGAPPAPCRISRKWAWVVGGLHGASHVALAVGLMLGFTRLNALIMIEGHPALTVIVRLAAYAVETMLVGGALGGLLMGLYLYASYRLWGLHENEVFSVQAIRDYKGFLRMRIGSDGALTIHPLCMDKAYHGWQPVVRAGDLARVTPDDRDVIPVRLIEEPLVIGR